MEVWQSLYRSPGYEGWFFELNFGSLAEDWRSIFWQPGLLEARNKYLLDKVGFIIRHTRYNSPTHIGIYLDRADVKILISQGNYPLDTRIDL